MAKDNNGTETTGTSYPGWRIFSGAFVVTAGLVAVVVSLGLILANYDTDASGEDSTTTTATTTTTAAAPAAAKGTKGKGGGQASQPAPVTPQPEASPPTTDTASVSASSVVAVMTPVIAGIVGITGLFFGISATGSARGKEAEVEQVKAETQRAVVAQKLEE